MEIYWPYMGDYLKNEMPYISTNYALIIWRRDGDRVVAVQSTEYIEEEL